MPPAWGSAPAQDVTANTESAIAGTDPRRFKNASVSGPARQLAAPEQCFDSSVVFGLGSWTHSQRYNTNHKIVDWKRLVVLGGSNDGVITCGDCSSGLRAHCAVDWRNGRRRMHRSLRRRRRLRADERKDPGALLQQF